jgi:hypothetical protein
MPKPETLEEPQRFVIDRYTAAPPMDIWTLGGKQKIARVCSIRPASPSPSPRSAGRISSDFGLSAYASTSYKMTQSDARPLKRAKTDLGRPATEKRPPVRRTTTTTRKVTAAAKVNI